MESVILNYREKKIKKELAKLRAELLAVKAEKKIMESQKSFFGSILRSIPSDLVVFDKNHKYQFVNPKAISTFRVPFRRSSNFARLGMCFL